MSQAATASASPTPKDLTQARAWEFRAALPQGAGGWRPSLIEAVRGLAALPERLPWPTRWTAFGVIEGDRHALPAAETLTTLPTELSVQGHPLRRVALEADTQGRVDLTPYFGPPRNHRVAFLFAEVHLDREGPITIHAGADWWMQWWIDGQAVYDTLARGNGAMLLHTAHAFEVNLSRGRHVLAVRLLSGAGGWALASEATRSAVGPNAQATPFEVEARCRFDVADPRAFAALTYVGPEQDRAKLNGLEVPVPVEGMIYRIVPAVPVAMLRAGTNELSKRWSAAESMGGVRAASLRWFANSGTDRRLDVSDRLLGLTAADGCVQSGPVLHSVGLDHVGIACRTNLPAAVHLALDGRQWTSPPALFHRFLVQGLRPGTRYEYALRVEGGARIAAGAFGTIPLVSDRPWTFAIFGDPSPVPRVLARTIKHILPHEPDAAVFLGDAMSGGLRDSDWDSEFFEPAGALLARVPTFAVIGNHDENSPVFDRLLLTAEQGRNWCQTLGHVRFIGLDGEADWSAGGSLAHWLENVLSQGSSRFTFVFDHYPSHTSSGHGATDAAGNPVEKPVRQAREVILPILARHRVTAFISGHSHCYERSEHDNGVTLITSGGAGGYLYGNQNGAAHNPYSRVFVSRHHYCLVRVEADRCELRAIDLDGEELDRRAWC